MRGGYIEYAHLNDSSFIENNLRRWVDGTIAISSGYKTTEYIAVGEGDVIDYVTDKLAQIFIFGDQKNILGSSNGDLGYGYGVILKNGILQIDEGVKYVAFSYFSDAIPEIKFKRPLNKHVKLLENAIIKLGGTI